MNRKTIIAACIPLFLMACSVGPDYQRPEIAMPKQWSETSPQTAPYPDAWWKTFNDPALDQLIAEAVASNLSLQQASSRIRDARAQQTMAVAAALPAINAKSNLSRRSNNLSSAGGSASSGGSNTGGGFGVGSQIINIFQAGFDAQWELDVFGGIRRGIEAADATVEAEVEDRNAILVSLLGEVARHYVQLRANQQLRVVTRENLGSQQQTLELTRVRRLAGLASELDLAQQQALVADSRTRLPQYEVGIAQAVHAIGILLGREPSALAARLSDEKALPMAAPAFGNLPSDLLLRRPDIRRTERQLAAANAQIGVATAELFPKFNLAAFLGIQNTRITDISPLGKSWSAAASISAPIFNWGKLQANIDSKEAQHEALLLAYRATILDALGEVENALTAYVQENNRQQALLAMVDAQQLALQLANERYRNGLTAFLDVLDSQRGLLKAQSDLIDSRGKSAEYLIALYKALGGGWESL